MTEIIKDEDVKISKLINELKEHMVYAKRYIESF